MAKTIKKSTKRRKTKKKTQQPITKVIFSRLAKLIKWLCYAIAQKAYNNPLISLGFCLFACFSSFLTYHAFFNQNMISRSFFFSSNTARQETSTMPSLTIQSLLRDQSINIHHDATNNSISANGNVIPLPRSQPVENNTNSNNLNQQSSSLIVVPQLKPAPLSNNEPTKIITKEMAQIMQVQKALRYFGNKELIVNGIADNRTKEAILAFQKMFALKEDGMINNQLVNKMREVGLLENDTNGLY